MSLDLGRNPPRNILIVRLSSLGDVVDLAWSLAALREAFPGAHIDWLVEDRFAAVVRALPQLTRTIVFPRKSLTREGGLLRRVVRFPRRFRRFLRSLRALRYDVVFDFHHNLKSGVLTRLARATVRAGFDRRGGKEGNFLFLNERAPIPFRREHKVDRYLSLLRWAGVPVSDPKPILAIPEADSRAAEDYRRRARTRGGPQVVLHPGSSEYGSYKRWPAERWGEVCALLIERFDADVVIAHGPGEEDLVNTVIAACPHHLPEPFAGSLLAETALIAGADLFLSGDTGIQHLASVVGQNAVAVFGPKDSALHGPYRTRRRIVEIEGLACKPCRHRHCPEPVCMTGISGPMAFFAVRDLLTELGFHERGVSPVAQPALPHVV